MKKKMILITTITFLILFNFLIYSIYLNNYEFVVYWIVLVSLFILIIRLEKKFRFPSWSIILFSIWSIAHMAGGLIKVNGIRLYDLILLDLVGAPFFILKYDQLIHAYCYFSISVLVYYALSNHFRNKSQLVLVFATLSALGIGLLNEVIEFGLVIFADAAEAVGGYYNTALDLVFNTVGAIIGPILANKISKK